MSRPLLVAVAVLRAAAFVTGIWFAQPEHTASFGWTAYSPLGATAHLPFSAPPWWSLALLAVGSAAVGAATTLLVVRSRVRPTTALVR